MADHFGMGFSTGMGGGIGRGMGMSAGMMPPVGPTHQDLGPEQELDSLKTQSQMLAQQLSEIRRRIEGLEKKE